MIAASGCIAQAAAAQGERLTVEVGECVDLPTPEQRLACFEAQVEAARGAPAAAPAATAPAATSTAPAPAPAPRAAPPPASAAPAGAAATNAAAPVTTTTIEPSAATSTAPPEFGFRERPAEPEKEAPPPPEVRARVAELQETTPNSYLITLDNGQVWRQTRADPYKSLKVGQEVRVYFSRWRAYRLDSPQMSGFLQVERVR